MMLDRAFPERPFHRPMPAPLLDEDFEPEPPGLAPMHAGDLDEPQ